MSGTLINENSKTIGVGLLGLGVVGSAVATSVLSGYGRRSGIELRSALVREVSRQRSVQMPPGTITTDPDSVLNSPDINIVIELMGGEEPALQYISRALTAGKHVVTANK